MTLDEIAILSPGCAKCPLSAVVVERQRPFTTTAEVAQPLVQAAADETLHRFYCAYHTTLDLEPAVFVQAEDAVLQLLSQSVRCEKRGDTRYASICVLYTRTCLKRCAPIKQLLRSLDLKMIHQAITSAWRRKEAAKEAMKNAKPQSDAG